MCYAKDILASTNFEIAFSQLDNVNLNHTSCSIYTHKILNENSCCVTSFKHAFKQGWHQMIRSSYLPFFTI